MADLLASELRGDIALIRLDRPDKRNAINDPLIVAIRDFFRAPPKEAKVVVLHGAGEHFCAGLDLSELTARTAIETMRHSQLWHEAFQHVQFGGLPVVAAMHGAVIGGGLELAAACHVRVAEPDCFYALPEGQRGIFVGGGASVRVSRLIGASRMAEMMLTGRTYDAAAGQTLGLSHYLVGAGEALDKALALAARIAANAPMTNYAVLNALPRIADMAMADGLFTESVVTALAQGTDDAQERLRAFLEKRSGKVGG
jgi:enoyl-CoA hydratase/carnithine racemase